MTLLTPANGIEFGPSGKMDYTWQGLSGASSYRVVIEWPTKEITNFDVQKPHLIRYLESIPNAGQYQWYVIALDSTAGQICQSSAFTFSKTVGIPEQPTQPSGGGGGGKKGGGGGGGGGGSAAGG
jgi:hypothetical protein